MKGLQPYFTDEETEVWEVSQLAQSYTTNKQIETEYRIFYSHMMCFNRKKNVLQ